MRRGGSGRGEIILRTYSINKVIKDKLVKTSSSSVKPLETEEKHEEKEEVEKEEEGRRKRMRWKRRRKSRKKVKDDME